jgi:adenylosuccinate lyase
MPDSCILTDYLLARTIWVLRGMRVYPERMKQNLEATRGLVFSGQVLLILTEAGMLREQAYKLVQSHAMHAWETGGDFRAAIENDPAVKGRVSESQLADAFSVDRQLRNIGLIFERVFGS